MAFDVFLFFNGDCRAALEFYAGVFRQKTPVPMIYGQNPGGCDPADKDRILYACLPVHGCNMMLSDCPSSFTSVKGNNIALTLGLDDEEEVKRIYDELAEGGSVSMKLGRTFFSELFGMVTDKFGIIWQVSKTPAG
jgi:PhnB protein